jgi:hypothetical protein
LGEAKGVIGVPNHSMFNPKTVPTQKGAHHALAGTHGTMEVSGYRLQKAHVRRRLISMTGDSMLSS